MEPNDVRYCYTEYNNARPDTVSAVVNTVNTGAPLSSQMDIAQTTLGVNAVNVNSVVSVLNQFDTNGQFNSHVSQGVVSGQVVNATGLTSLELIDKPSVLAPSK